MRRGTVVLLTVFGVAGALLVVGFLTRTLAMDAADYRVPSESMVPTVQLGDRVTLNRGAYDDGAPGFGDVVIFRAPASAMNGMECGGTPPPRGTMCARPDTRAAEGIELIKRIVGLPGERLALRGGRVVRDGRPEREPYVAPCDGDACDFPRPIRVPDGHVFVLGDNRGASDDGRFWGPIPLAWVQGRVEDCDILRVSCSPIR
jgi:signal peptidase I